MASPRGTWPPAGAPGAWVWSQFLPSGQARAALKARIVAFSTPLAAAEWNNVTKVFRPSAENSLWGERPACDWIGGRRR
jgi:hypothetical protein